MLRVSERTIRMFSIYSLLIGIAYLLVGIIEFIGGLLAIIPSKEASMLYGFPPDLLGGFSAIVISLIFLGGAIALPKGKQEALGYPIVGAILGGIFALAYLLIIIADGVSACLSVLEGEPWSWSWLVSESTIGLGILRPEIWLFLVSAPLGYSSYRRVKTREVS